VVASVHTAMKMPEKLMTMRVCTALEQEGVNVLGHPTGRLLNEREPISLNLNKVFEAAKERGILLEINSSGKRLDLNGEHIKFAKDLGCTFALSTDAHEVRGLKHYDLGIMMARRGWLEKKDLVNCWDIKIIEKVLKR